MKHKFCINAFPHQLFGGDVQLAVLKLTPGQASVPFTRHVDGVVRVKFSTQVDVSHPEETHGDQMPAGPKGGRRSVRHN